MPRVPRIIVGLALFSLVGCGERSASGSADNLGEGLPEANATAPELPVVEQPLTRRDVLLAVIEAASRFGAGIEGESAGPQALDGRTFSFRIRFCQQSAPRFRSSLDPETRVLKVEAKPDINGASPAVRLMMGSATVRVEAVEGFWVPRPWLLQAACPPSLLAEHETSAPASEAATVDEVREELPTSLPTVGIVELHSEDRARSALRQQRPYRLTKKLAEATRPGPVDLVLQGRLQRTPGGRVITCMGDAVIGPPTCLVSVRIDQVRMEAASGELLAEWSNA